MKILSKDRRPIIGITTGELKNLKRPNDTWTYGQNHYYPEMVESVGGAPFLIPSTDNIKILDELYELMDGVMLAGGNDVDPSLYGQQPHPTIEDVSQKRDATETYLLKRAEADKKPLFAICRGAQLWNIVNGGTLYQHLPDHFDTEIDHYNSNKTQAKDHDIVVEKDSKLHMLLGLDNKNQQVTVNSYHHQAVNKLGQNLRAVAWADDGIIEAIESDIHDWFAVGVQWHPESMDDAFRNLFESFVQASKSPSLIETAN